MSYSISEAAALVGVSPSALRYYDKQGLLPNVARSEGGIRRFEVEDLEWLRLIECLKSTGMPIKDIKTFCDQAAQGDSSLAARRDMFYERRHSVVEQMQALQRALDTIEYKCWFYDSAVALGASDAVRAQPLEQIPPAFRDRMHCRDDCGGK